MQDVRQIRIETHMPAAHGSMTSLTTDSVVFPVVTEVVVEGAGAATCAAAEESRQNAVVMARTVVDK